MAVDFLAHLERQLRFLENSAAAYDSGHREEAVRIGTCVRVLCHQTKKSTSLLRHLNAESTLILSTSTNLPAQPGNVWNMSNNFMLDPFLGHMWAKPALDSAARQLEVPYEDWWAKEIIFYKDGLEIFRKDIVLWSANQDGGAHVDETPHRSFEILTRGLDFTWTVDVEEAGVKTSKVVYAKEMHLAALRQFAYELLNSRAILRLAGR